MCVSVVPVCLYVSHVNAWCPQKAEYSIGSPRTGVIVGFKPLCGYVIKPLTLEEQSVLLATELFLQPLWLSFSCLFLTQGLCMLP